MHRINPFDPDLKALSDWYRAFFGSNLCLECPSEVRKAIIQFNKMAKQKEESKPKFRFKPEHLQTSVSIGYNVINASNLDDKKAELLKENNLEHLIEPNE